MARSLIVFAITLAVATARMTKTESPKEILA